MSSIRILETPDKSENDKKLYRLIRLENGLEALLISDFATTTNKKSSNETNTDEDEEKSSKLAACSLCVNVGSFSDPRDIQGLAHFLEHMVFMGSEKYPSENAYEQYIQNSGGSFNATTNYDRTCFFFDSREEFFDGALDRFSQFFKAPLMLKEAMTREREAVASEFALRRLNEFVRRRQVLASIAEGDHPSNSFTCGNLKTLKENIEDDVLYEKVHEFRRQHYSAHRMHVCLKSKLPLDDLQDLANRHFSTILNNHLSGSDFSKFNHQNAFQSKFYEKVYFVKPVTNISKIELTWCMEPTYTNFKCNPNDYVAHLLGHEGKGSLLSYLRKKSWAVELVAGMDYSGANDIFSLFSIAVHLTDDGFDHLDDVLSAIFSYLRLLQLNGPNESIFRELQTINANEFRYAVERNPIDIVKTTVLSMKKYPPKNILNGASLYFEYDENVIRQTIDVLNTPKFNIMITSKRQYNEQITYDLTEQWMGTKYSEIDMPKKWISLYQNATTLPEFTLPETNQFITNDFNVLYQTGNIVSKYPTKILDNELCELWFRQDDTFLLPTACYYFVLMTPFAIASVENMNLMILMTKLLNHQFVEKLYPATNAGLHYNCYAANMGIVLKVEGYSQKLHMIVDEFSKSLKSLADDITEKQYEIFLQQQVKGYENVFLSPGSMATELRLNLVQSFHQPLYVKYQRLRSIKFTDMQQFCRKYCEHVKIKAIMQGNITETHALNIMQNVLRDLNCGKVEDLSALRPKIKKLPVGASYLRCKTYQSKDVNTVITNYYQFGPTSRQTRVLLNLLVKVAAGPVFDTLRTKEQLAYSVAFQWHNNDGIYGYSVTVNSQESKFSVDHVDDRIENFRRELITFIENLTDDNFDAIKASLIKAKLKKDYKLHDEVQRNWTEIINENFEFDRQIKESELMSTITKQQFLQFYRNLFGDNERKLSVQIIGNANALNDMESESDNDKKVSDRQNQFEPQFVNFSGRSRGNLIQNLTTFKETLEVYPLV